MLLLDGTVWNHLLGYILLQSYKKIDNIFILRSSCVIFVESIKLFWLTVNKDWKAWFSCFQFCGYSFSVFSLFFFSNSLAVF